MSKQSRFFLMGLVLLAAALRFHGLFANTFEADEALFASWARLIAIWRDPLLQSQVVDKPPLLFYLQALFFPLFGPVEWAARMPNFIASLLLVPMTGLLAWKLFRDEMTTRLATVFVVFSPLAIQFSSTAFIDPLLSFLLVATLVIITVSKKTAGPTGRIVSNSDPDSSLFPPSNIILSSLLAGMIFGLAVITKYQSWLFLPLIIGLGILSGWGRIEWRRWILGLVPFVIVLLLWDLVNDGRLNLIGQQLSSYGGLRLTWSWELWPRLVAWGEQWRYLMGAPILIFALIFSLPVILILPKDSNDYPASVVKLLLIFLFSYFVFHWLLAIPVWDRYILPLVPIAALVLGRLFWHIFHIIRRRRTNSIVHRWLVWLTILILMLLQAPSALKAYRGQLPIGGQPFADDGAGIIAQELWPSPYGTVLYDHWYSWQWRYHLFDQKVYVSWFPDPEALTDDLAVFGKVGDSRFLVMPNTPVAEPVKRAVARSGYILQHVRTVEMQDRSGMVLYRIVEQ